MLLRAVTAAGTGPQHSIGSSFSYLSGHLPSSQLFAPTYTKAIVLISNEEKENREAQRRVEERVVGQPSSLLPGLLLWCDAVHRDPDTETQRSPFNDYLLIYYDSQ